MKNLFGLLFLGAVLLVFSCGKDDEPAEDENPSGCDTMEMTYTDDIKEILDTNCAISGCHSEAEATMQGAMHDYDAAKAFADFGRMVGAINHEDDFSPMPYPEGSAKLPACTIDKIEAWINDGAPE